MSFLYGMFFGISFGIGLMVAYARYENVRSRRRAELVLFLDLQHCRICHSWLSLYVTTCRLFLFLICVNIFIGKHSGCIFPDDSPRFKKTHSSWILSSMGCFSTETEGKISNNHNNMLQCHYLLIILVLIFDFFFFF